jgi:hypothetical protein
MIGDEGYVLYGNGGVFRDEFPPFASIQEICNKGAKYSSSVRIQISKKE